MGAPEPVQEVVHARERVKVMDCHFVERPKIEHVVRLLMQFPTMTPDMSIIMVVETLLAS